MKKIFLTIILLALAMNLSFADTEKDKAILNLFFNMFGFKYDTCLDDINLEFLIRMAEYFGNTKNYGNDKYQYYRYIQKQNGSKAIEDLYKNRNSYHFKEFYTVFTDEKHKSAIYELENEIKNIKGENALAEIAILVKSKYENSLSADINSFAICKNDILNVTDKTPEIIKKNILNAKLNERSSVFKYTNVMGQNEYMITFCIQYYQGKDLSKEIFTDCYAIVMLNPFKEIYYQALNEYE